MHTFEIKFLQRKKLKYKPFKRVCYMTLPQFLKIIRYISHKMKTIMKVRIGL